MGVVSIIFRTLCNFGRNTTIAGVNNAARAGSKTRAVYWLAVCAVGVGATAFCLFNVVDDFLSYPYVTNTDVTQQSSVEFPAVTFCNHNRISCSNLISAKLKLERSLASSNSSKSEQTLKVLDEILTMSFCLLQICKILIEKVPEVREPNNCTGRLTRMDRLILLQSDIRCAVSPLNRNKSCSYLTLMQEQSAFLSDKDHTKIASDLAYFACNKSDDQDDIIDDKTADQGLSEHCKPRTSELVESENDERGPRLPEINRDLDNDAKFLQLYMRLDPKERGEIGHKLESTFDVFGETKGFLSFCSYRGIDCKDRKLWLLYNTPSYGNCYVFNYIYNKLDLEAPRAASLTGTSNGLTLELFLDQPNYMLSRLSTKAGARIVVHSPSLPPLPDEYGLDLAPNTANSIALQQRRLIRLPAPFGAHCFSHWNETSYNITTDQAYSITSCQRYCLQRYIIQECHCFNPDLVQDRIDNVTDEMAACYIASNVSNLDYLCFIEIMQEFDEGKRTCSCQIDCRANGVVPHGCEQWDIWHLFVEVGLV